MSDILANKVAVVIGGSGGIGAAAAQALAAEGARVVVTWRSGEAAANALLAGLPGEGHLARRAVIEDSATLTALAGEVERAFGRCDILVNTAGYTKPIPIGDLDALTDEFIDDMFKVNWRGQFAAIRAFTPLLKASGDGLIVNVSSIAGLNGVGSNLAYAAIKAGIDTMTKSLARALAPAVRVMAVSPGVVATDFVPGRDAAALEKVAGTIPLKRVATAEDVGRAIAACATHLTYSTGSLIVVDGGRAL
ncbi:SDR family NAD(P)-dependent oxidoreductase [Tardiphaga sp. 20_F10_N6_6]|jgi:3-oxoacyl-[acyl-carrier protein] reductase|uniref:SDR family NAD(P)-dependent oxidoreductase n=1 Tax=unclassified Tardiphaga TaxID=2631404 RepID=UPI000B6A8C48|nr:SDR family oxidoreductase [Tardiphaga sp. OK246]SNT42769.1 3-oxoacyl-[acyl-carrier protein] reductase [Tardiphaga sp. OK246]